MGIEISSKFCKSCNAQKKVERKTPNHILHLILVFVLGFFTLGIGSVVWILVWLILSLKAADNWVCSTCGSKDFNNFPTRNF